MIEYIQGDLLTIDADIIAHQINSLSVKSHGLSSAIKKKYPWADRYGQRKAIQGRNLAVPDDRDPPGSAILLYPPEEGPIVACLVGQYEMGPPGRYKRLPQAQEDTPSQREAWFKECLALLARFINREEKKSVAFPDHIGCGLAGGDWNAYSKMIEDFALSVPDTKVLIVRLT